MIKLLKIKGDSLFPLYKNDEIVFCVKSVFFNLKADDIVVFRQEKYGLMIKKIKTIKDDEIFCIGTNPTSIDSRDFGFIKNSEILYKVLFKIF